MISSRFRKVKAKNGNSDPCIIVFLVPYFNFPRTFPHRETGFELRLFWFWIKRLNAFSMSLAHKYVNLKDHQDIKEQVSTKSFLKKNTGSTWNPQPRGIVWIRCFPNPIRYLQCLTFHPPCMIWLLATVWNTHPYIYPKKFVPLCKDFLWKKLSHTL